MRLLMDNLDITLLWLAGKAVNTPTRVIGADAGLYWIEETKSCHLAWNPLSNDGDALRLAIDLGMINPGCFPYPDVYIDVTKPDWYAATRRAIVVAAAKIGAKM